MPMPPFLDRDDPFEMRIFADYGAIFASRGAVPPPAIVFESEREVDAWQSSLETRRERFGDYEIELQRRAMAALVAARDDARLFGLDLTARDADAGRRSYGETVALWRSRVEPALDFWTARGRLDRETSERIRALAPRDQIPEVLALEERGIWFSTTFEKSILYSVAAPGTSQHLSLLAVDLDQFDDARVREILARHGWHQTVVSDLPHFTYLGAGEAELPALGLSRVVHDERSYWVPDLAASGVR
jgi:hypothetical protein